MARRLFLLLALSTLVLSAAGDPAAGQTLTLVHTFHHPAVSTLTFSPDGKTLATGGGEWATPDCVRLWDVASGKLRHTFRDNQDDWYISGIAFSPDGKTLAYSCDNFVRLWSVQSGHLLHTFSGELVGDIQFSPHNRLLASGSSRSEAGNYSNAQIWNLHTGRGRILPSSNGVSDVTFSRDGQHLIGYNSEERSSIRPFERVWNAGSGIVEQTHFLPSTTLLLSASSNQRFFVSRRWDAKPQDPLVIWEKQSGKRVSVLLGPYTEDPAVAFSASVPWLAIGEDNVSLWNWRIGRRLTATQNSSIATNSVVFSPNGKFLAAGSEDGTVRLWQVY